MHEKWLQSIASLILNEEYLILLVKVLQEKQ